MPPRCRQKTVTLIVVPAGLLRAALIRDRGRNRARGESENGIVSRNFYARTALAVSGRGTVRKSSM
ncbi:MAG: hypothetical protein ACOX0O_03740 [Candidatus Methanoculleus thermohydrogenotrophicum]